jgi:hypothetical protein
MNRIGVGHRYGGGFRNGGHKGETMKNLTSVQIASLVIGSLVVLGHIGFFVYVLFLK